MKRLVILPILLFALYAEALACTSAVVAPHRSSEGVPLLWKHRDNSKFINTRIEYIDDGTYAYTAVVPNTKNYAKGLYGGINEKGLGIISTATKNLPESTPEEYKACPLRRLRGGAMWNGLRECATIDEFEELLKTTKRSRRSHSNFGVGDATGAVAYFEVWDVGYRRYDVSDSGNDGFDVRANFSHAGDPKKRGTSMRRYNLIMNEMKEHKGAFSPFDFIGYSRSYNSVRHGSILTCDKVSVCSNHTVPRSSSIGAFVMVCDGKNPRLLVTNGHPVPSLAVPVYVNAKGKIPQCVKGNSMRLLAEDFQAKAYIPIADKIRVMNKELISKVLKINQPKIEMPSEMPKNITAFNAKIDKAFAKHEKRVRKVLDKATIPHPLHD